MSSSLEGVARECSEDGSGLEQKIGKLGYAFLSAQEISSQEAVCDLLGLPLRSFSCKSLYVPLFMVPDIVQKMKAAYQLCKMPEDCQDIEMNSKHNQGRTRLNELMPN